MKASSQVMTFVPFFDLKRQYSLIREEIESAVCEVLASTHYSDGPFVEGFEQCFAAFCDAEFAVGVNSGTSALHLSLLALGVKPGDEVLVPANTFIATAWAVSYVGGVPVFVDCDLETWNIDVHKIEARISPRTKAIIGVHLYGLPCDMGSIQQIAKDHRLFIIEDCAQAHGATYKGRHVGSFGEAGCLSFYPGKNLGACGEGGALITNNRSLAEHIRVLRNHGASRRYYHDEIGFNMRMDGIQAAILKVKLGHLSKWNARRQEIARMYHDGIKNKKIKMQRQPEECSSVHHLFVITTEQRDELLLHLQDNFIQTALHYPVPCHLQQAYQFLGYQRGDCPRAEYLSHHCLSLPMFPELTNDEVEAVTGALNSF
jgi:dTDP-4-amino-4,6-dideoxygalactose transaminase